MSTAALRRIAPALGLFALAPVIGECLLGNLTLSEMALLLPLLAPMYGGGALLIREVARRAGRGPSAMLVLGLAYALVEEGLVDQMLFNRLYAGHDLMGDTYIPALGMGAWLTLAVLTMHAVWSTTVAIVLVEALVPGRSRSPWLGRTGLVVTGLVFVAGSALVAYGHYLEERFVAAPWQLAGTAVAVVTLIAVALCRGRRAARGPHELRPSGAGAPGPWAVGLAASAAGSLFTATEQVPGWWRALAAAALPAVALVVGTRWCRRPGWGPRQQVAAAGGALLAYAGTGFFTTPESAPKQAADYGANAALAAGAVLLLICATRATARATAQAGSALRVGTARK
ncbi:DUF998 domain-containing protein [Streptomyces sp. NPDC046261]|uniref:DUF998 domain-containing protein n=1 Tax=Streptomyces sp. NPDC046261 TaxID=3157200 RepID=UPI0033F6EB74